MGIFSSLFKSEVPDLLDRLENIRTELDKTHNGIQELAEMEKRLSEEEATSAKYETLMRSAVDSYGVSVWIKDLNSHFIFANKTCCDVILKCTEAEALGMRNGHFKKDKLAPACMEGDQKVISSQRTRRFIESAVYDGDKQVYIDVIKSPVYENGTLIGTIGSATDITANVPNRVKDHRDGASSIEIPLDTTVSRDRLAGFLERRKKDRK